jgi:hypothetical protein
MVKSLGYLTDYYVFAGRDEDNPQRWHWEIRRKSKPLGTRLLESGFQSETAASFAGKRALAEFLDALWKEERRSGR